MAWQSAHNLQPKAYICGHCGHTVGGHLGWHHANGAPSGAIYVCPHCDKPTYFDFPKQRRTPGVPLGADVEHLPEELASLYNEARRCCSVSAHTAAVLLCRKLLMNVAVSQGATTNQPFIVYVEYLATNGYVPPNGKTWVDHIRKKGNEATHEIQVMTEEDSKDLIAFSEMLLKFVFEFPGKIPKA